MTGSDPNRFSPKTKQVLERRANSICSNPNCGTVTSGPHTQEDLAINLGEAAHINGANPGSARYDHAMLPEQRSHITNGIWLCGKCAKLIDSDSSRYSVELLFQWKRTHERKISEQITGESWEKNIDLMAIENAFSSESPAALQIALDKPDFWEYLLTIELLRDKMKSIELEYIKLERGLLFRPSKVMDLPSYLKWFQQKNADMLNIVKALSVLINEDLPSAWGPPGNPGDPFALKVAIDIFDVICRHLLEWEIDLYFMSGPDELENITNDMKGWAKSVFDEVSRISRELAKPFESENPSGNYSIDLKLKAPSNMDSVLSQITLAVKRHTKS